MHPLLPYTAGGNVCGSEEPIDGRARDIEAIDGGFGGAEIRFAIEATNAPAITGYVDGLLATRLAPGSTHFAVAGLTPGNHTLSLVSISSESIPSRLYLESKGQRVRLRWARSEDAETVAYRVLWDAGANVTPATALADVSALTIQERVRVLPDANGGGMFGRLSAYGTVPPGTTRANVLLVIGIAGAGAYEWATDNGLSGSGTFNASDVVNLAYGVRVTFHDDPGDYATDALWAVEIGPARDYLTDILPPGRYQFAIQALDAAGNASDIDPDKIRRVQIIAIPEPVSDVVLTKISDTEVKATWTDPDGIAGVNVYCNYNSHVEQFTTYIADAERPFAVVAAGVEEWIFTALEGLSGQLRFRLRPYFANGMEREDLAIYKWSFPQTPTDLGLSISNPTGLKVTPTAGGNWLLEWDYVFKDGDDTTGFYVWQQDPPPIDFTNSPIATVLKAAGTSVSGFANGPRIKHYSLASSASESGEISFSVRAANLASGVTSLNTNYVTLAPDATAPEPPGALTGGPT